MGIRKDYSPYRSYQYLEEGKDYRAFSMAQEVDRVPPYRVPLTKKEEARVKEIAEKCLVVSLHDHPAAWPEKVDEFLDYIKQGRQLTAYQGLSTSCLDAIFDNFMDGGCLITSKNGWKWTDVIFDLGMRLSDLAHQDFVIRCERVDEYF